MIPAGVQIYIALEPVDMRFSFDRLAGIAKEQTGYEARSGALFVFFGRRRDALKVLFFDGSGMCQFYKRLDRSVFQVPEPTTEDERHVEIDDATLEALLDGIDIEVPRSSSKVRAPLTEQRFDRARARRSRQMRSRSVRG